MPRPTLDLAALDARLRAALRPVAPPVAIAFVRAAEAAGIPRSPGSAPPPNAWGRSGRAAAGCVFWIEGAEAAVATDREDHANCSVGSYTHGFLSLADAATRDDVRAVLEAGWVDEAAVRALPRVAQAAECVVYAPLATSPVAPDVVLVRVVGLGLMTLRSAFPDIPIEGKPQCHIVALAKERRAPAASVGCALSRARTGMRAEEMTAALPGAALTDVVERLEAAVALDREMARYAAADAKRFA